MWLLLFDDDDDGDGDGDGDDDAYMLVRGIALTSKLKLQYSTFSWVLV